MRAAVAAALLLASTAAAEPLPFQLDAERGAVLVEMRVNGRKGLFVLDTGSAATIVSLELAGLPRAAARPRFSEDGPGLRASGVYADVSLAIGARALGRRTVAAMDMTEVSRAFRRPIDGLLGQDVLRGFGRLVVDYRERTLELGVTGKE